MKTQQRLTIYFSTHCPVQQQRLRNNSLSWQTCQAAFKNYGNPGRSGRGRSENEMGTRRPCNLYFEIKTAYGRPVKSHFDFAVPVGGLSSTISKIQRFRQAWHAAFENKIDCRRFAEAPAEIKTASAGLPKPFSKKTSFPQVCGKHFLKYSAYGKTAIAIVKIKMLADKPATAHFENENCPYRVKNKHLTS